MWTTKFIRTSLCRPQFRLINSQAVPKPSKTKSKVFRSILSLEDIPPHDDLNDVAQKNRADIILLRDSATNLCSKLQDIKVPIYIRTQNPASMKSVLRECHACVEGFVSTTRDAQETKDILSELRAVEDDLNLEENYFSFIPVFDSRFHFDEWAVIAALSKRNIAAILEDHAAENHDLLPKPPTRIEVQAEAVLAARAAGINIVLGADVNKSHYSFYRRQAEKAKDNGFDGRVTLNKDQSVICHDVFSVSKTERATMDAIFNVSSKGIATHRRSDQESRNMVGPPHRALADDIEMKLKHEQAKDEVITTGKKIVLHPELRSDIELGAVVSGGIVIDLDIISYVWSQMFREEFPVQRSDEQARRHGFEERVVPFSLLLAMSMGLSVMKFTSPIARFHLGNYNGLQYRAIYRHDEINASYVVNEIRHSKEGYPILKSRHFLRNKCGELIFSVDKVTMLQKDGVKLEDSQVDGQLLRTEASPLLDQVMGNSYRNLRSDGQRKLLAGQILVHKGSKTFNRSEARGFSNILRGSNNHHFNVRRFLDEDIVVPGPGLFCSIRSITSADLGDVVYESCQSVINVNITNQTDTLRCVTAVRSVRDVPSNPDLEEIELKTIAIKNTDLELIQSVDIPGDILANDHLKPSQIEKLIQNECPELTFHVVGHATRTIIRVKNA